MQPMPNDVAPIDEASTPNPFATRYVRPGALPYRFGESGGDVVGLVDRLAALGWVAQLIGPHGSGKSTLVAVLESEIVKRGRTIVRHTLAEPASDVPNLLADKGWTASTLLVVDGYERLGWLDRLRFAWRRWKAGAGLLATTHRDEGFPVLFRVETTPEIVIEIAARLQLGRPVLVHDEDAVAAWRAREGNVREALFDLYDVYEARRAK